MKKIVILRKTGLAVMILLTSTILSVFSYAGTDSIKKLGEMGEGMTLQNRQTQGDLTSDTFTKDGKTFQNEYDKNGNSSTYELQKNFSPTFVGKSVQGKVTQETTPEQAAIIQKQSASATQQGSSTQPTNKISNQSGLPGITQPTDAKIVVSQPTDTKTAVLQPTDAKTAASQPVGIKTTSSQPTDTKTIGSQPTDKKTTASQPTDGKTTVSQPTAKNPTMGKTTKTQKTIPNQAKYGIQDSSYGNRLSSVSSDVTDNPSAMAGTIGGIAPKKVASDSQLDIPAIKSNETSSKSSSNAGNMVLILGGMLSGAMLLKEMSDKSGTDSKSTKSAIPVSSKPIAPKAPAKPIAPKAPAKPIAPKVPAKPITVAAPKKPLVATPAKPVVAKPVVVKVATKTPAKPVTNIPWAPNQMPQKGQKFIYNSNDYVVKNTKLPSADLRDGTQEVDLPNDMSKIFSAKSKIYLATDIQKSIDEIFENDKPRKDIKLR